MTEGKGVDIRRVRVLREAGLTCGPVIYWMDRDQRVQDNWAMQYACEQARLMGQPVAVLATPYRERVGANSRQAAFLLAGLRETAAHLERLRIPFYLLNRADSDAVKRLIDDLGAALLVTDMSPLRAARTLVTGVATVLEIPVHQVDAHNIVPVWEVSPKQEYAAYTFRPKINRVLSQFLTDFPTIGRQQRGWPITVPDPDWEMAERMLGVESAASLPIAPGTTAAFRRLDTFVASVLPRYAEDRNDPNTGATSGLSPYLNLGQLSAQRVALTVQRQTEMVAAQEAFLEELIVRRELSDNFCWYNDHYDSIAAFPEWALGTLRDHQSDPRAYLYSQDEWEAGETHDELWNAAQAELLATGVIHGYMRMYWAKKLLEWSATPESALSTGLYLNDRYALDGNDPNGFVGLAWSIGGVHDRPWSERDIYGRIRYMNANGCARKFDVRAYIERQRSLIAESER